MPLGTPGQHPLAVRCAEATAKAERGGPRNVGPALRQGGASWLRASRSGSSPRRDRGGLREARQRSRTGPGALQVGSRKALRALPARRDARSGSAATRSGDSPRPRSERGSRAEQDVGVLKRIGAIAGAGSSTAALCVVCLSRRRSDADEQAAAEAAAVNEEHRATRIALEQPLGRYLVIAVGLGDRRRGSSERLSRPRPRRFRKELKEGQMGSNERRWYTLLGIVGYVARGVVFALARRLPRARRVGLRPQGGGRLRRLRWRSFSRRRTGRSCSGSRLRGWSRSGCSASCRRATARSSTEI